MCPHAHKEWEMYPRVFMTDNVDWDPSILDGEFPLSENEEIFDSSGYDNTSNFDAFGVLRHGTVIASAGVPLEDPIQQYTALPDFVLDAPDFSGDDEKCFWINRAEDQVVKKDDK